MRSKPRAIAQSTRPDATARRACNKAVEPVEQLLLTLMTGIFWKEEEEIQVWSALCNQKWEDRVHVLRAFEHNTYLSHAKLIQDTLATGAVAVYITACCVFDLIIIQLGVVQCFDSSFKAEFYKRVCVCVRRLTVALLFWG